MVDVFKHVTFCYCVRHLFAGNQLLLLQHLHGVDLPRVLFLDLHDLAKRPWGLENAIQMRLLVGGNSHD